jgi:hypothetical protein
MTKLSRIEHLVLTDCCMMSPWQPNGKKLWRFVALPAELSQEKNVSLAPANPAPILIETVA